MQRMKVISDLLISVSKAERHEARMKVRQDSLRLGNVGVIRYLNIFKFDVNMQNIWVGSVNSLARLVLVNLNSFILEHLLSFIL